MSGCRDFLPYRFSPPLVRCRAMLSTVIVCASKPCCLDFLLLSHPARLYKGSSFDNELPSPGPPPNCYSRRLLFYLFGQSVQIAETGKTVIFCPNKKHWFPGWIPGRELCTVGSNGCLKEPSPTTDLDGIMACHGWEIQVARKLMVLLR